MKITQLATGALLAVTLAACTQAPETKAASAPKPATMEKMGPGDTLLLDLKAGQVKIKLRPDIAPKHVARITELANSSFYDGLKFHRVITGFMAQTGDPRGNGTGGSSKPDLKAEFSSVPFTRGVLGMARSQSPDSANSQFFIMFNKYPSLDGQYTVFGEVSSGMEFVDAIKKGAQELNGTVDNPDTIIKMRTADKY